MKSLASRVAALEKKQKPVVSDSGYKEERFTGEDGLPWVRYTDNFTGRYIPAIELPCNGRDDPMGAIAEMVEAGVAKPSDLTPGELEIWNLSIYQMIGEQIITRILSGEVKPDNLTPHERDCWELVEAVREKY